MNSTTEDEGRFHLGSSENVRLSQQQGIDAMRCIPGPVTGHGLLPPTKVKSQTIWLKTYMSIGSLDFMTKAMLKQYLHYLFLS